MDELPFRAAMGNSWAAAFGVGYRRGMQIPASAQVELHMASFFLDGTSRRTAMGCRRIFYE